MNLTLRGDTSTDCVLNAIQRHDKFIKTCKYVSTNHFDVDSFLSSWCVINYKECLTYEIILRECARIGDFRELRLDYRYQYESLLIVCWLNTMEKQLFYRPFESMITMSDGEMNSKQKFNYFLYNFKSILLNPCSHHVKIQCHDEYECVLSGYQVVNHSTIIIPLPIQYHMQLKQQQQATSVSSSSSVPSLLLVSSSKLYHDNDDKYLNHTISYINSIGLVIVRTPEPLHYYSLFSVSRSYDMVLSIFSNHRYELELKYTTMVDIHSRPTLPRVDMHHVVHHLNKVEEGGGRYIDYDGNDDDNEDDNVVVKASTFDDSDVIGVDCNVSKSRYVWHADSITDSGPILRLECYNNDDDIDNDNNNNDDTAATANAHESIVDMDYKKKNGDDKHFNDINRNDIKNNSSKSKKRLTKAERYAHPYERQVYSSKISYMEFEQIILSYFTYAYYQDNNVKPKWDWSWNEIHQFNKKINWKKWNPNVIYL